MSILFQMSGADAVKVFLSGAAARMRNPSPGLRLAGEEIIASNTKRTKAGVDVDGKAFKRSRRSAREGGGQTLFDTGELIASQNYSVTRNQLDYFSTSKKARTHYDGLTLLPKKGKYLTIPLRARGGLFAGVALDVKANRVGDRAGHYGKSSTFFLRKNGRLFLMQKTGAHTLRALFLLVRSVKMPARRFMGFSTGDIERVRELLARHLTGERS